MAVKVTVLFFAGLREALGCSRESLELPAHVRTAQELQAHLQERGGVWAEALSAGRTVRVAVDQGMAAADTRLHDGAEVAFFPPVTGG
jgi:molybdopterin synthase sulfur carrier subunit